MGPDQNDLLAQLKSTLEAALRLTDEQRAVTGLPQAEAKWRNLQRVLADCGGNKTQAARVLGVSRQAVQQQEKKGPPRR